LLEVYRQTGDKKYLEPIPRALAYLAKSARPDGRLPRFLELQTNKPLYFTRQYELTYSDADMPTHYAFVTSNNVARLRAEYERLAASDPAKLKPAKRPPKYELTEALRASARQAIDGLDARGAWVEAGRLRDSDAEGKAKRIITTQTFLRNLDALSRFLPPGR
jgi:hypothetical protein